MNRRWICNDVWMDIFPSFDHAQLGLKMALLSPRFNLLVDTHFDGKRELSIWRTIKICRKNSVTTMAAPELSVFTNYVNSVPFPLPDHPLPNKIRFKHLRIEYIDHSVIAFLRSNHQIFGTNLELFWVPSPHTMGDQLIWDVFVHEIWPIFSANIRHLGFSGGYLLDKLRCLISPTILTDLNQLNSIYSVDLLPDPIGDDFDGPNATISSGQALYKWLHTPRKDGQPKRLRCALMIEQTYFDWVNNFKEQFLRANAISSVSYEIYFAVLVSSIQMVSFELMNEWTKEKLTLAKAKKTVNSWIMKRCKIGEAATIHWKDGNWDINCNNVIIWLFRANNCIGPLSPPVEEAGKSITKGPSSADK